MDREKIVTRVLKKLAEKESLEEDPLLKEGFDILEKYKKLNKNLSDHLVKIKKDKIE